MAEDSRKLFVAGLPDAIDEAALKQIFEATGGSVVDVSLPKDRATGRPRGFGFVTLSSEEEALSARSALDGSLQAGRSISVRPFQAEPPKRGEGGPRDAGHRDGGGMAAGGGGHQDRQAQDRTLYVGNLPYDTTTEEVQSLIEGVAPAGVVRVHLPMDQEGRRRGFGFVTMSSADVAKNAIEGLQGADVRGRRIIAKIAHPKGERPPRSEGPDRGHGGDRHGGAGGPSSRDFRPPPSSFMPPPIPAPERASRKHDDKRRKAATTEGQERDFGRGGPRAGKRSKNKNYRDWESWDDD